MKVRIVLQRLKAAGWFIVATEESHHQLKHPTRPGRTTVAGKPSDEVPPGTLKSIEKQSGLELQ